MTAITNDHVEWAVVDRLRKMLEAPPCAEFNVTHSYALFVGILLWAKQRIYTPEANQSTASDKAAVWLKKKLGKVRVEDPPWSLRTHVAEEQEAADHADFDGFNAADLVKWLRDSLAHGDGRNIRPNVDSGQLLGFDISFTARGDRERCLRLTEGDMRRIGVALADNFCKAIRRGSHPHDGHFGSDASHGVFEKAA